RRAHSHAVELRSQRRLLARESTKTVSAGDHRSRISVRICKRGGAAEQRQFPALVDAPYSRTAQTLKSIRTRLAGVFHTGKSPRACFHPSVRERASSGRGESVAFCAGCRTRSPHLLRIQARRDVWRHRVSRYGRTSLPAHSGTARVLLVHFGTPAECRRSCDWLTLR